MSVPRFGRFAEAALWVLVVLAEGPAPTLRLLDEIRRRAGPVGPGTLFGAIARLEAATLIERAATAGGPVIYRTRRRTS